MGFPAIAACSSGSGAAGIAVIRISGENSLVLAGKVFRPSGIAALCDAAPRRMYNGEILSREGRVCDVAMAAVFHAPASYTGENLAELYCHGSPAVVSETLSALFSAGALPAEPGEFTKRAFLNKKLDLLSAEAVGELLEAATAEAAQNAAAQIKGAVYGHLAALRGQLMSLISHFYAVVDFPDEGLDPFLIENAESFLTTCDLRLGELIRSHERGRILKKGLSCAIIGLPNTGKSTLLNALCGYDRAIVTPHAGTTRDVIEEKIKIGPLILRLKDTAGIRRDAGEIERLGIERAKSAARDAGLVIAVFDKSRPLCADDFELIKSLSGKKAVAVINKNDLGQRLDTSVIAASFSHVYPLSAKSGEGLEAFCEALPEIAGLSSLSFDGSLITSARQAAALAEARQSVCAALFALSGGLTPDMIVMEMESAALALGKLTGQTVDDEIVKNIFSRFCVGK